MSIAGLIFTNLNRGNLPELTRRRTLASVPFGCRYRLIDFPLSNMVNAGITNIGIVTDFNYQSLIDHIGNGKDWDLARRSGGLRIIPPYFSTSEYAPRPKAYLSRLDAMLGTIDFVRHCNEEMIVLCDSDVICNVDLNAIVDEHRSRGADITYVAVKINADDGILDPDDVLVEADENGRITSYANYMRGDTGEKSVITNMMVMKTEFLRSVLENAAAHRAQSFYADVLRPNLHRWNVYVTYLDTFCARITTIDSYYRNSMALLESGVRSKLLKQETRPIFTKVRNSAPTRYLPGSHVTGSLIADGCVIEGTVENSILFRGVHVGKGTVVRNSILLQNAEIGDNVTLNCVISDKDITVHDGRTLSGHETMPFYIDKGANV